VLLESAPRGGRSRLRDDRDVPGSSVELARLVEARNDLMATLRKHERQALSQHLVGSNHGDRERL
jgi:hypothetical protein